MIFIKKIYILVIAAIIFSTNVGGQNSRIWATYYGGTLTDEGCSIATDNNGNVYFSGAAESTSGIASGGFQNTYGGGLRDAFLVKFSPNGTRLWATYYGGSGTDYGNSIAIDASGNIYMAGETSSSTGIATVGAYDNTMNASSDGFLVKFDANGNRIWGTYYGGTSSNYFKSVSVDPNGDIYCAGYTSSTSGIATVGAHQTINAGGTDGMLVKFNAAGNRLWATYYGGGANEQINYGKAVTTDASSNVFVVFTSFSPGIAVGGFQTTYGGSGDGLLVKFNASGNFQWSTYYGGAGGGPGSEFGHGVATDALGNAYYCGRLATAGLASGGFQNTMDGSSDAILVKFDPSGARIWATYYGGANGESGNCVSTDSTGNIFMSGSTNSPSGIYYNGFQNTQGQEFLVKFDPLCNRICATYYDAYSGQDNVHPDKFGNVYLAARGPASVNVPYSGFQMTYGGGSSDAFLVKFNNFAALSATSSQTNPLCNGQCTGTATAIPSGGQSPYTYLWSNAQTTATINNLCAGTYSCTVTDALGSTSPVVVNISEPTAINASATATTPTFCIGSCTDLNINTSGGNAPYTYNWMPGNMAIASPNVCPTVTTTYTCTVTDANSCTQNAVVTVTVNQLPVVTLSNQNAACINAPVFTLTGGMPAGGTYSGIGVSNNQFDAAVAGVGTYTITYSYADPNTGCSDSATNTIVVNPIPTVTLGAFTAVCADAAAFALTGGLPAGGTYSGVGVNNNQFDATVAGAGTHTITYTYTDVNTNCSNSATNTIVVNPLPPTPIITVNGTTFTSSAASGNQWYLNGNPINGATNQTFVCTVNGNYTVCVTDANGCKSCSAVLNFTTIGISQNKNVNEIIVYPNPFSGEVTLSISTSSISKGGSAQAILYNTLGELVYSTQLTAQPLTINLQEVPTGIYFLQMKNENGIVTKKIIKQ